MSQWHEDLTKRRIADLNGMLQSGTISFSDFFAQIEDAQSDFEAADMQAGA